MVKVSDMFHRRGANLAIKVFIHVLIHSCVFRWVYVGRPYFQVSFNESRAYLGHFPLKLNIHWGIVPSPHPLRTSCFLPRTLGFPGCSSVLTHSVTICHLVTLFQSLSFVAPKPLDNLSGHRSIGTRIQQDYWWGADACHHGTHSLFGRIHSFLANNPNQTGLGITTYFHLLLESCSAKRHILLFLGTERARKPLLTCPRRPFFHSDLRCGSMKTAVTVTKVPAGTSSIAEQQPGLCVCEFFLWLQNQVKFCAILERRTWDPGKLNISYLGY